MAYHMPTYGEDGDSCSGGSCGGTRIVEHEATGSELPGGFTVQIGATLANTDYHPGFLNAEGDVILPAGWWYASKTTTSFVAKFAGDSLTPGAIYRFQLVEG